jgi:regulator of protease activity HflC (stomatin/prohibitin superfamily)
MSRETEIKPWSGWGMLFVNIVMYLGVVALAVFGGMAANSGNDVGAVWQFVLSGLLLTVAIIASCGFVVLQPNEAGVFLLFGRYVGTFRREGFLWVNPFYTKKKISLRLRNLNSEKLKVNDQSGNPIEIGAVVVWKVEDTYAACFEVDDYTEYVDVQSESAIRHLASAYPYDSWEDVEVVSLRGNIDDVSLALEGELRERLSKAGVVVHEARIAHLAYAPEIAEAMLKRQQASAVIAARTKIVEGAVGMVSMALARLKEEHVVDLDDERRAAMVSNLLVVLCGETGAQPIVNVGTLYT